MKNNTLVYLDKFSGIILIPLALVLRVRVLLLKCNKRNHERDLVIKFLGAGNFISLKNELDQRCSVDILTVRSNLPTLKKFNIGKKYFIIDDRNGFLMAASMAIIFCQLFNKRLSCVINLESESIVAKFFTSIPVAQRVCGITNINKGLIDPLIYDFYLVSPLLLSKKEIYKNLQNFGVRSNREMSIVINERRLNFFKKNISRLSSVSNICLSPTCSNTDSLRRLSIAYWRMVIINIPVSIIIYAVFPSKDDAQYLEFIELSREFDNLVVSITTYDEFELSITGSNLLISVDSQALHIAQLNKILTICVYGPTSPFGVLLEDTTYPLTRALDCSPCTHKYFSLPCKGLAPCTKFENSDFDIFKQIGSIQ